MANNKRLIFSTNQVRAIFVLMVMITLGCSFIGITPITVSKEISETDNERTAVLLTPHANSDEDRGKLKTGTENFPSITFENLRNVKDVLRIGSKWNHMENSPDGQHFVIWNTKNIWLYDTQNISLDPKLIFTSQSITSVSWSPVEELLAVLHSDYGDNFERRYKLLLVDPINGKVSYEIINGLEEPIMTTFSNDGSWLAVPTGNELVIYDTSTGTTLSKFRIGEISLADLKVNNGNNLIALCLNPTNEGSNKLSIYNKEGALLNQLNVYSCDFNWTNGELVIATTNRLAEWVIWKIVDPLNGNIISELHEINSKETKLINNDKDKPNIWFVSVDNSLDKYNSLSNQHQEFALGEIHELNDRSTSTFDLAILPGDEKLIAITDHIIVYDIGKQTYQSFRSFYLNDTGVKCFFTASSQIVNQGLHSFHLWDVGKGKIIQNYDLNDFRVDWPNQFSAHGTSLSPNGRKILVSTTWQGAEEVFVLNAEDFKIIKIFDHPFRDQDIGNLSWINNNLIVVANNTRMVIMDSSTGKQIDEVEFDISFQDCCGNKDEFSPTVKLSPDQSIIAVVVWNNVFLIDTVSMSIKANWPIDTDQPITDLAWYPDSKRFVISLWDGRLSFWNIEGEKVQNDVVGSYSTTPIYGLSISPSGNVLIYQSGNNLKALNLLDSDVGPIAFLDINNLPPKPSKFSPADYSMAWSLDSSLFGVCSNNEMVVYGIR